MKPLGDGFIKLVRMLIAPIIFTTVVVGMAQTGAMKEIGRIGMRALLYFEIVSTLALIIGLVVVEGRAAGRRRRMFDPATVDTSAVSSYTRRIQEPHHDAVPAATSSPTRWSRAFSGGEILQVLLVSMLFGLAMLGLGAPAAAAGDGLRRDVEGALPDRGAHHAAGADRRVRRDGVHRRPLRRRHRCCRSAS